MEIGAAKTWLSEQLATAYEKGERDKIAIMVLEHLTGFGNAQIILHQQQLLGKVEQQQLAVVAERLARHEPVQYVLGEAWFYDLKFYVNENVLIPRPETEELVDWVIRDVRASGIGAQTKNSAAADLTDALKILDIGTGSGCIALALKKHLPLAEVWGCDASDGALTVARRNGSELDVRVDFIGLDFLDAAQRRQLSAVNIIVSNPPYIPIGEKVTMHPNVVQHEPHLALFVPDENPLVFYRAIAAYASEKLQDGGAIYLEIHEQLGAAVLTLLKMEGFAVTLRKDMQGKDRMVKAVKVAG